MKRQRRKRNGMFDFLTKKRVTYHGHIARGPRKPRRMAKFKGVQVWKLPDGSYTTGIDKDSHHDTLRDAQRFIASWKKNPAKFDRCVSKVKKSLKKQRRSGNAYAICSAAGPRNRGKKRRNIVPLSAWDVIAAPSLTQQLEKAGSQLKRAVGVGRKKDRKHKRRNPTRRNTVEAAEREYQATHGRPAEKRTVIKRVLHEHSVLPGWGKLERLDIESIGGGTVRVEGFKGALLAFNEQRKTRPQLFIEGGDQSVDLRKFGIQPPYHETEVLGLCKRVYYFTTKDHLRPEDGGTATYKHSFRFGKRKPTVIYDTVNKLLSFAGGKYTILDEGIDN